MKQALDYLFAFDVLLKAFNNDLIPTEDFLKSKDIVKGRISDIQINSPISFGDTEHQSLSVNDLMEALADNSKFMNYCDAIVTNAEGKLLITQRTNSDEFQGGKWCLPGGKADQGEFLKDAVKRELIEETGLIASNCNYSTLYRNEDGGFSHYFWCYVDDCCSVIFDADEIQQYAWVELNDLHKYDFMFDLADRIKAIFNIPFKGKYLTEQELVALSVNKIEKAHTDSSLETAYSKGCLMLDLNFISREGHNKWDEVLMMINPNDVYNEPGFGKEYTPHITVLYGFTLPAVSPYHIEVLLPEGAVSLKIVDVSYFDAPDYDVLKFGIESEQLHELNGLYRSLPHENKFPEYKPHCTIAYLKKGRAEKYISVFKDWVNYQFQSSKFDYSHNDENGNKTKCHWDVKGFSSVDDKEEDKIVKARQTYEIGQISQSTGLKKVAPGKWIDPKTGKPAKTDENGTPQQGRVKPADISKLSNEDLAEYAKNSSEADLQAVVKESREPKLRQAAHDELDRRSMEEAPQEEKKGGMTPEAKTKPKAEPKPEPKKEEEVGESHNIKKVISNIKLSQSVFGGDNAIHKYSSKAEKELRKEVGEQDFDNLESLYNFTKSQTDTQDIRKKYRNESKFKEFLEGLKEQIDGKIYRTHFNLDSKQKFNIGDDLDLRDMSSFSKNDDFYKTFIGDAMSTDEIIHIQIEGIEGIDLSNFSDFPKQKEVLLTQGESYKIHSIKEEKVKQGWSGNEIMVKHLVIKKK